MLVCDVTGSTDRVSYLPLYMQTDKVKKVCFRIAVKMERKRLNPVKEEEQAPVVEAVKEELVAPKQETPKIKKRGKK